MARGETFSSGPEVAPMNDGLPDRSRHTSRPNPEEGHRLMRAFLSLRQAALREAVINFVKELSTLQDDGP